MISNIVRPLAPLFSIFAAVAVSSATVPTTSASDTRKLIEIAAEGGVIDTTRGSLADFNLNGGAMAGADLEAYLGVPFFRPAVDVEARLYDIGTASQEWEVRGSASLAFLKVQEVLLQSGDNTLPVAMGGLGVTADIGGVVLATVSVGAAYLSDAAEGNPLTQYYGAYAGTNLYLVIDAIKLRGEVDFAYYLVASPDSLSLGGMDPGAFIDEVKSALVGGARARAKVAWTPLQVKAGFAGLLRFGPEVEASLEEMPDGTQWRALAGVRVQVGR